MEVFLQEAFSCYPILLCKTPFKSAEAIRGWLQVLQPLGYQILWLPWAGASEAPPEKSSKESLLTPYCYITFVTWFLEK